MLTIYRLCEAVNVLAPTALRARASSIHALRIVDDSRAAARLCPRDGEPFISHLLSESLDKGGAHFTAHGVEAGRHQALSAFYYLIVESEAVHNY
jgi:hypothetical protein